MHEQARTFEVSAVNSRGEGIGREPESRKVVFLPGALPGERVIARTIRERRSYAYGEVLEIHRSSPFRIAPPCSHYGSCGGCHLQHAAPTLQMRLKQAILEDHFRRIGGGIVPEEGIPLCQPSPDRFGYRNHAILRGWYPAGSRRPSVGFYQEKSRSVVPLSRCPVLAPPLERLLQDLPELLEGMQGALGEHKGSEGVALRLRTGVRTGHVALGIDHASPFSERELDRLYGALREYGASASVFGRLPGERRYRSMHGEPSLAECLCGLRFAFHMESFFQVNTLQAERLFNYVLAEVDRCGCERVVELFSGVGVLALMLAPHVGEVVAVEGQNAAVKDARRNGAALGASNVSFVCDDVTAAVRRMERCPQCVVLDPPRSGCTPELLQWIQSAGPETVVYVSCNPATLARDLRVLVERGGYRMPRMRLFDMFPQTYHVESVVTLQRDLRKTGPRESECNNWRLH
ncbi:MAG: 23S rRNA (uracil(1939)-C(5))-methyltransferase RlmD [Synergistales bacterium]|nr:23S rRNA (uracil(1939)-C(5))-methyltransferase RlmD [Synergistales bacterium]